MIPVKSHGTLQSSVDASRADPNGKESSRIVVKRTVVTPTFQKTQATRPTTPTATSTVQFVRSAPKTSVQTSVARIPQGTESGPRADPAKTVSSSRINEGIRSFPSREARTYEAGTNRSIQRTPSPSSLELPSRIGAPTHGRSLPSPPRIFAPSPATAAEQGARQRVVRSPASVPTPPTAASQQSSAARGDQMLAAPLSQPNVPNSARPTMQMKVTINERRRHSGNATLLGAALPQQPEVTIPAPAGASHSVVVSGPTTTKVVSRSLNLSASTPPAAAAGKNLAFQMPMRRSNSPRMLVIPQGGKILKSPTAAGVARPAQSGIAPRVSFPSSDGEGNRASPVSGPSSRPTTPLVPSTSNIVVPNPPKAALVSTPTESSPAIPQQEPAYHPPSVMPPSALAQPNKPKTEKPKKVIQIQSDKQDEPIKRLGDNEDYDRRPSMFNFSDKGTVYAACPRCGASYNGGATPCILQCNHTFCSGCIERLESDAKVACPRCKKCTSLGEQGVAGLPRNYALTALGELNLNDLQRHSTIFLIESLDASCPICLETYGADHTPLTLGCGHTACDSCIMQLAVKAGSETLECPTCREKFALDSISANLDLKKTIEAVRQLRKHAQHHAAKKTEGES
eukprot:GGOE01006407.1.p1 GENE.GGOE01006407.1~~GGOE01006407.1.p1  ORF type:complete len:637 (+),score=47.76 GGOE01006407.1:35-1912(+)